LNPARGMDIRVFLHSAVPYM